MSNYLAIATVTAVLKRIIQAGVSQDVPGAQVTTNRPEAPGGNVSGASVNVFLYSATPNPAWRNADLRTRRPKGEMVKHGQAGLDLNYIFTFYGNEQRLEPQRLLGSTVQTLVDHPAVSQEMIRDTITSGNIPELSDSTLGEQVQSVKFLPSELTNEELSRMWSIFFQIPYSLSFTYQATAVLIQGRKPGKAPLPVRSRRFYTSPALPAIEKIDHQASPGEPITLDSHLVIRGNQLQGEANRVQIGEANLTPSVASDTQVEITLATLANHERERLRAGVQGLRILLPRPQSPTALDTAIATNVLPIVLCPIIINGSQGITLSEVEEIDEDFCSVAIAVQVDLMVGVDQPVFLLLNGESRPGHDGTCIVRGDRRPSPTNQLTFTLPSIRKGDYLVRVQINGAESPLEVDTSSDSPTFEQYIGPSLAIYA
ncbi:MAG: DUF4255 domain-containing protein [Synechococcales bacterium]|nr:DUF4255 domain-containing protein [Synechococcales bacterium]